MKRAGAGVFALLALLAGGLLAGGLLAGCVGTRTHSPAAALPSGAKLLPARVRRLSNFEYERTVNELVGATEAIADRLPPDVRQEGYTVNADQAVPAVWAARLDVVARDVAHRAVAERLDRLAPCATSDHTHACVERFVTETATRAWRRPIEASERAALLQAFDEGAAHGGFAAGAELVLTILLESPSLLYLTELGEGGREGSVITLSNDEIASALAYAVRGGPPDAELLDAAAHGSLRSAETRELQAKRLIGMSDTRHQFRRFVLEWLEVDDLDHTAKSAKAFPRYDDLEPSMLAETTAFVDEVMVYERGSLHALLDAGFASVDPPMARFYGLTTYGPRASLSGTGRLGLLQQASFLAAHAHEDGTSPVKRGDFILRKVLCKKLPRPAEIGIDIVMPPPTADKTTRERFAIHDRDPACRSCHASLDALGATFEGFDAMGGTQTSEHGRHIDTTASVELGGRTRAFTGSTDLSRWLATEPTARDCFARHAFRYFTGESDPKIEDTFLALPRGAEGGVLDDLLAFIRSDLFIQREVRTP